MKYLNFQKGISSIIAVIVLAVILIVGGAYYFKQQAKPASKSNVVDVTANWKTYSADDGNFQIKYPSDWFLSHESGKDSSGGGSWGMWLQGWIVTNFSVDSSSPSIYLKDNGVEMKFDISGENSGLTLDNIVPCSQPGGFSSLTCSNVMINGISYKKYTGQTTSSGPGIEPYILVVISTISNHKAYTLHAFVAQGSDQIKNTNTVNQILSTFKFTGQASTPTQGREVFDDGSIPTTWAVAGINDPQGFKNFFVNFQKLVKEDQKVEIAKLIRYPLKDIKNEADFIKNYDQMFTQKVKTEVINQNVEQIFRNDQGVMVGNGEIWFHTIIGKSGYWIIAINN
jgi:hypothetical protein